MKEAISLDRIANSIIQRRKKYDNFILVEGSHDRLFFLKFKNKNSQIEIAFGWEKLIEIISKLKDRGFDKVIGIIDKDLREIIPETIKFDESIIITDDHDLNIICIEKSFDTIFQSYCSEEKVEKFKKEKNIDEIKDYIHEIIKPLSFLKILNKREKLNLSFKGNDTSKNDIDFSKFVDKRNFELISKEKLVEAITNYSRNRTKQKIISNGLIIRKLNKVISEEDYSYNQINSGHDFGQVICLGLKKVLGTKDIASELFLKESILNYGTEDFKKTDVFKRIKTIEKKKKTLFLKK